MTETVVQKIYWGSVSRGTTYLYGSGIRYGDQEVCFENMNFASGKPIKKWLSRTNYQGDRTSPSLPLLRPGKTYGLELVAELEPAGRFYIRLDFINRQNELIGFEVLRDHRGTFTYPEDAFTYSITLHNGGCHRLRFSHLILTQEDKTPSLMISDSQNSDNGTTSSIRLEDV